MDFVRTCEFIISNINNQPSVMDLLFYVPFNNRDMHQIFHCFKTTGVVMIVLHTIQKTRSNIVDRVFFHLSTDGNELSARNHSADNSSILALVLITTSVYEVSRCCLHRFLPHWKWQNWPSRAYPQPVSRTDRCQYLVDCSPQRKP